ncbi:IS3 family transposase [Luteimonas terricola]|uniref:HTH-like domain-containing protein n=1 Tax=Luteimonas terricola TaxID=645597 RepID=A0ABQ2EFQ1_9GAMM|nr:IS3 family transposase [Luteimonas terricola]GGK10875.1 hypothetical protein GCM10011394_20420 [Luteimonas terricola]
MQAHLGEFRVNSVCRVLGMQRTGRPATDRVVKLAWLESGGIYRYRKVTDDLLDLGEHCGKHRVARLMAQNTHWVVGITTFVSATRNQAAHH